MLVGNPGQPALQLEGIAIECPQYCSFRVSYLDDYIFRQSCHDEFLVDGVEISETKMKLSTYAAMLTLNLVDRLDFYGILGSTQMQIDQEIFTKRRFAWGAGGKIVIFKLPKFKIGLDAKYFQTKQRPTFLISDHLAYNVISNFALNYQEIQVALGMTGQVSIFAPYINATYLIAKLTPEPRYLVVRFPDENLSVEIPSTAIIGGNRWGMALGLTLIDQSKASLAVEWRTFNQDAIDVNLEVRF
jgi:hypothetical protein